MSFEEQALHTDCQLWQVRSLNKGAACYLLTNDIPAAYASPTENRIQLGAIQLDRSVTYDHEGGYNGVKFGPLTAYPGEHSLIICEH